MTGITTTQASKIDIAIYAAVAKCGGASLLHEAIIDELAERFPSRTIVTRMIAGSSEMSFSDARIFLTVLQQYEPSLTLEDLIP